MKNSTVLLINILLLGLVIRLGLALEKGYEFDMSSNQAWGRSVVVNGLGTAYEKQVDGYMTPNYPPLSLALFGGAAHIYRFLSPDFSRDTALYRILIKLPAILGDLVAAATLFYLLRGLRGTKEGLLAAFLFVIHPAVWFDSTVWGQTDILYSLLSFFTVLSLVSGRLWLSGVLATLALMTKTQAIIFFPLFFVLAACRPRKLYKPILTGIITIAAVLLPFALQGQMVKVWHVLVGSVGFYTDLTFNAYNFWWSMFAGSGGHHDTDLFVWPLTFRLVGFLIVGLLYAIILWRLVRTLLSSGRTSWMEPALTGGALCTYAFFLFSTEMHERYLFPLMLFGMPLALLRRDNVALYLFASIAFYFNLSGILPYTFLDKWFFTVFPGWDAFIASLHIFLFFLWLYRACHTSLKPQKPLNWKSLTIPLFYLKDG